MSKKKNQQNLTFFQKHNRFKLTVILFFVIVPIVFISSLYFYHGVVVKPVLFGEKSNKLTKNMGEYFAIDTELEEIKTVFESLTVEEEAEGKEAKILYEQYKFSFELTINKKLSEITFNSLSAQLSPKYYAYNSGPTTITHRTKVVDGKTVYYGEFTINYAFDKTKLPLMSPKEPRLYWKIDFSEKPVGSTVANKHVNFYRVQYGMNDVTYL